MAKSRRGNAAAPRHEMIEWLLKSDFSNAPTLLAFMIAPGRSERLIPKAIDRVVRSGERRGCAAVESRSDAFESIVPGYGHRVYELVGMPHEMAAFRSSSSPAPGEVDLQLAYLLGRLGSYSGTTAESLDG